MDANHCSRPSPPASSAPRRLAPAPCGPRWPVSALLTALVLLVAGPGGCSKAPDEKTARTPEAGTTGSLVLQSNLPGTTVEAKPLPSAGAPATANSRTSPAGQTLAGLAPGPYALTARAPGWPDLQQEVRVDAGRATEVTIRFPSGSLRLDSVPSGATVRRGDTTLGRTPLTVPQLPPGACRLVLDYPTWPAVPFTATIVENTELAETVRLPHGKLTITTTPAGATVLLGKTSLGQTPLTLEPMPAGPKKLILQAKDFPALEVSVTLPDRGDVRIDQPMGLGFPELDPAELLRTVWVPDDPDALAPSFDSHTGIYQPRNDIVKNLHRKRLYENWLRRTYRLTGVVKSYAPDSGQIEFTEQKSELSKYRVLVRLTPAARANPPLAARLTKGASIELYGRLTAVEEPRWPSRVITLEMADAEPLR